MTSPATTAPGAKRPSSVARGTFRHALVLLAGFALVSAAFSQERTYVPFEGTEAFGNILHTFDLEPLKTTDLKDKPPGKTLVVVFGNLAQLDSLADHVGSWERFREEGGALLLVSDEADRGRLARWGLAIPGGRIRQGVRGSYKGALEECPLLKTAGLTHPLWRDMRHGLATNRPSWLISNDAKLPRLLGFPEDCYPEWWKAIGKVLGEDLHMPLPEKAGYVFGSPADAPPAGRVVVIAGQGMFMNGMLVQEDNDNFTFAINLVRWLAEGPQGARQYALFLEDGKTVSKFGLPLKKTAGVPVPPLHVINQMLRGVEKENLFNRMLVEGVGKRPILRWLLLAATVGMLVLAVRALMRARFRRDHAARLVVSRTPEEAAALALPAQREQALVELGNYWEPAQALVRQFFLDHAGIMPPLWRKATDEEDAIPPRFNVAGSWWRRQALARKVNDLWDLVQRSATWPVARAKFLALLRTIDELAQAVAAGELQFERH